MKIAIPARNNFIDSQIDERFGRSKGFIIYDSDSGSFTWISNQQSMNSPQGAGIQAAKNVIDTRADVLIACNVGPKAFSVLQANNIEIYLCSIDSISKRLDDFKAGRLQKCTQPNAESHW